ncbi:sorting nexin-17 [Lingula anatina]|uniref:Sorting nexin-17 n=1 Tax=Lingula anatina TaxID=7574 RepID=A0A1S3I4B5_LINAN|nr:sorting nexin-17 [Lingula anatina]|eukprot:XP_013392676.1 sorting nexin-17 [Lingula anatina]
MHFSIPETQDCKDESGSTYTVFKIHVNGVHHCTVRYSQLHNFHEQMKKEFGANSLPQFPPKKFKLLQLGPAELEERRAQLEKYIQIISQNPQIANSDVFNGFFLSAQQETQHEEPERVTLDVFLMNGHKITVNILSTDQTEDVLETVASNIELKDDFVFYFGLYLVKKEGGEKELSIIRKLQDFESPFISLKAANKDGVHKIVLRKSYWDSSFDDDLLEDRIAMNLLYVQAQSDLERGWIHATKEQMKQLTNLHQKGSKKEYLRLARTLKYYGFLHFKKCQTDYPQDGCAAVVAAGNRELNFRIQVSEDQLKEGSFKITRMRCWRITTTLPDEENENPTDPKPTLEIAFEYLMAKDTLKWITLFTDEAILISMCLQGMVDELIMKKQGKKMKRPQDRVKRAPRAYLKRDGTSNVTYNEADNEEHTTSTAQKAKESVKKISDKLQSLRTSALAPDLPENDAFVGGIGDDDL